MTRVARRTPLLVAFCLLAPGPRRRAAELGLEGALRLGAVAELFCRRTVRFTGSPCRYLKPPRPNMLPPYSSGGIAP